MIRYRGIATYKEKLFVDISGGVFLGALKYRLLYDEKLTIDRYIFGVINNPKEDNTLERLKRAFSVLHNECSSELKSQFNDAVVTVLKMILPHGVWAEVTFGFDDPYRTGQALEGLTVLYALMGDKLQVTPVWDNEIIDGKVTLNGRLSVFRLLILVLKLLKHKEFRDVWRAYNE